MKKLLIISLISSSLLLVGCFNQGTTPEIKNQNVENIQSGDIQTGGVNENTGITEQVSTGTVSSSGTESNSGIISNTQNESKTSSITFSDIRIKDILAKIYENTKKQQISTGTLMQGDFKAEYIAPKDYSKDTDKIIVTISGIIHELPGTYGEKDILEIKKCTNLESKITFEDIRHNGECPFKNFGGFIEFSPSGNYLSYLAGGWETSEFRMIDVKTGKVVLKTFSDVSSHTWTLDKKQYIYGTSWGITQSEGLVITKKGAFPEKIIIQDKRDVSGLYADENYIYSKEGNILKIYNLNSLKEVFSKEITK